MDFSTALSTFQQAANYQHPEALLMLGIMYGYGYGTSKNPERAIQLLLQAYQQAPSESTREQYSSDFHDILSTSVLDLFKHCAELNQRNQQLENQIQQLQQDKQKLERCNHDLQTQLDYAPGAAGYQQAHDEFYRLVDKSTNT